MSALSRALAGVLSGRGAAPGRRIGYHGTPFVFAPEPGAPFGRFRTERIGEGFGKQAYGHGLYDSASFSLADGHRQRLLGPTSERWLQSSNDPEEIASGALYIFGSKSAAEREITRLTNYERSPIRRRALADARRAISRAKPPRGRVMEIDAPASGYLDWDAPLSEQDVANRLAPLAPDMSARGFMLHDKLVNMTGSQPGAAEALRKAGLTGIRYRANSLDGATENHVVFRGEDYTIRAIRAIRAALLALLGAGAGGYYAAETRTS